MGRYMNGHQCRTCLLSDVQTLNITNPSIDTPDLSQGNKYGGYVFRSVQMTLIGDIN